MKLPLADRSAKKLYCYTLPGIRNTTLHPTKLEPPEPPEVGSLSPLKPV